ncbi:CTD nuclear envelope phosphatase 1 [Cladochytrium tenue]|nr:CTD nuclear envelope phosphatase 1 [Cladochytrium tenue]
MQGDTADDIERICYFVQDEDRLLDYWKTALGVTEESAIVPPAEKKHLFIDIDDVLVSRHGWGRTSFVVEGEYQNWRIAPRPYIPWFLSRLEPYYHLHAFTSSNSVYARNVLNRLPNTKLLKNVFTRDHCVLINREHYKIPRNVMSSLDGGAVWTREYEAANSVLFDNDPFYAEPDYRDNVVTAKVFKDYDNDDYLFRVLGLLKALAVQGNIQSSLRAWKEDWMAKGIVRQGYPGDFSDHV